MKYLVALVAVLLLLSFVGCTDNERARTWGGTATVTLDPGEKLVTATWKNAQLWYLTRPMAEDETPVTSTLHEDSSFGLVEGKVIFVETR